MILKADFGGVPIEIWFTPSFNIKTTDKRVEHLLRSAELEIFDPWEMRMRKVKATKSLRDAYLLIEEYKAKVPELGITFEQFPEVPSLLGRGTDENPILH